MNKKEISNTKALLFLAEGLFLFFLIGVNALLYDGEKITKQLPGRIYRNADDSRHAVCATAPLIVQLYSGDH